MMSWKARVSGLTCSTVFRSFVSWEGWAFSKPNAVVWEFKCSNQLNSTSFSWKIHLIWAKIQQGYPTKCISSLHDTMLHGAVDLDCKQQLAWRRLNFSDSEVLQGMARSPSAKWLSKTQSLMKVGISYPMPKTDNIFTVDSMFRVSFFG